MVFMKNCLASIFDWWHENETFEGKMFHMNVYPHHPLYEGPEGPEGSLSVLFRFLSDRILLRVLSDGILLSVLSDIGSSLGS